MNIKRITAIVPEEITQAIDARLRECAVAGLTVEKVRGYGRHPDSFSPDLMTLNARVVVYAPARDAERIMTAIIESARSVQAMAGIVAIESIEQLVNIVHGQDIEDTDPLRQAGRDSDERGGGG